MKNEHRTVINRHLLLAGVADQRLARLARREFADVVSQRPPAGLVVEREARRVVRQVVALGEREEKLILISYQDETNNANVPLWRDHERQTKKQHYGRAKSFEKRKTPTNYVRHWRSFCQRTAAAPWRRRRPCLELAGQQFHGSRQVSATDFDPPAYLFRNGPIGAGGDER